MGNNDRPPAYRSLLESGFSIAAVSYRLSHRTTMKGMVKDILSAVSEAFRFCRNEKYHQPALFLWGVSAGGHLASLTAHLWDRMIPGTLNIPRPLAVSSWCGPMDLTSLSEHPNATIRDIFNRLEHEGYDNKAYSPLTYAGPDSLPHLFIHGAKDELVPLEQPRTMHKRLIAAGVHSELVIKDELGHAMPPDDSDVMNKTKKFFSSFLKDS